MLVRWGWFFLGQVKGTLVSFRRRGALISAASVALLMSLCASLASAQITYYYTDTELHRINLATSTDTLLTATGFPTVTQSTALAVDNSGNVYFTNQQQVGQNGTAGSGITIYQWTPTGSPASTTGAVTTLCTLPSTFPVSTGPGAWVGQEIEFGRLTYDRATDAFYTLSSLIAGSPNPAVVFRISRTTCAILGVVAVTPAPGVPITPGTGGDLVIVNGRTFVVGSNSTVNPALPTLWEIDEITGQVLGARSITGCPANTTNLSGVSLSFDGSLIVSCATAGVQVQVRTIPAATIAAPITGTGTIASVAPTLNVPVLIGDLGGALTSLGLIKTIPSIIVSGSLSYDVTFTLRVQNQGAQLMPNFQTSDRLLDTFVTGGPTIAIISAPVNTGLFNPATGANTPAAVCAVNPTGFTGIGAVGSSANNLFDGRQEMDLGQGCDVTFTVRVTYPAGTNVPTAALTNTAQLGSYAVQPAAGGTGTTPVQTTDGINPKPASVVFSLPQNADLVVDKVSTPNPYVPGQIVTYTIKIWNKGPNAVTGSTVADTFPILAGGGSWTYSCVASGSATCGALPTIATSGTSVSAATGSLPVNNIATPPTLGSFLTVTVSTTTPSGQVGALSNTATITPPGGVTDPVPGNNSESDTNSPNPRAGVTITKSDGATVALPGTSVVYSIVVSNSGPSDANNAIVTDPAVTGLNCSALSCSVSSGAAGCPIAPTVGALQGAGIAIPTFPALSSITLTLTCSATASGV